MSDPKITPRAGHTMRYRQWTHCQQRKFIVLEDIRKGPGGVDAWISALCCVCGVGVEFMATEAEAVALPPEKPN